MYPESGSTSPKYNPMAISQVQIVKAVTTKI
jgi:hypothetical protein